MKIKMDDAPSTCFAYCFQDIVSLGIKCAKQYPGIPHYLHVPQAIHSVICTYQSSTLCDACSPVASYVYMLWDCM